MKEQRNSFKVWAIFAVLKIIELSGFFVLPVLVYGIFVKYAPDGLIIGWPITNNLFLEFVLGWLLLIILIIAVLCVFLLIYSFYLLVKEVFLKDYIALNLRWARQIAGVWQE